MSLVKSKQPVVYGIELLADNIEECRAKVLAVFSEHLILAPTSAGSWP